MTDERRRRVLIYGTAVLVLVAALAGAGFLPWSANHFGYALPGTGGLPYRIHHQGRDYDNNRTCAGAGWCAGPGPSCRPHPGPMMRVDDVLTYFGASHDVFVEHPAPPGDTPTVLLVEEHDDCYVGYALSGGP